MLRVAHIVPATTAEGPHTRLALWVHGCTLRCPGCCNPDLFDPEGGEAMSTERLLARLDEAHDQTPLEGITVLGGEPLQQPNGLLAMLRGVQARGLGAIVFTGYATAAATALPEFAQLADHVDTWVTGPFDATAPELRRRFIGSANQQLVHQTPRYADETLWQGPARIEVRIAADGSVRSHGLPRPIAQLSRAAIRRR